jgi:Mn2+/Fe2+ NRAMP family transporter
VTVTGKYFMSERSTRSVILGAAFLMATSAVGPGFLTQTTVFTKQLLASFGFVILLSIILDIFAQLNIWQVLTVSGKRGQDVANETIPGSGYLLAFLVAAGGLIFNIGNIGGSGLGLNVLFDVPVWLGSVISAGLAIGIFLYKEAGKAMDLFVKVLGVVMIALIAYVLFASQPPLAEAAYRTFVPETIDPRAIVTLVGGTVGGYITFAGAHRLIDAGISGVAALPEVRRSAVTGIILTACIRFFLFLAALGVISLGFAIDDKNPPASVFQNAAGTFGYKIFGIVMWSAAITSVIGAAFTSVSFLKTFSPGLESKTKYITVAFIAISTAIFLVIGNPVSVLVWAGTINGFILPLGLAIVLIASHNERVVGDYKLPSWLRVSGWFVVAVMTVFSVQTLWNLLG